MGTKLRHSFEGCGSLGGFAATGELIIPNGTILLGDPAGTQKIVDGTAANTTISVASLPAGVAAKLGANPSSQTTLEYLVGMDRPNELNSQLAVIIGDSTASGGNYQTTAAGSALSASGTTVTVTMANHNLWVGAQFFMGGCLTDSFNGVWTVASVVSTSVFTFTSTTNYGTGPVSDASATVQVLQDYRVTQRNFLAIANATQGWPIRKIVNRAVSGTTTAQQLARIDADVLAVSPSLVLWLGFTNDIRADATYATITANITSMVNKIAYSGAYMILCTSTPFDSGATGYTATRLDTLLRVNGFIRQIAAATPRVLLLDVFALTSDPSNATSNWKTNYNVADKIHPSELGCQRIAAAATPANQSLASLLQTVFPLARRIDCMSQRDDYNVSNTAQQYYYNPLMQGLVEARAAQSPAPSLTT